MADVTIIGAGEPRTYTEYRITMRTAPSKDFVYRYFVNSTSKDWAQIQRFLAVVRLHTEEHDVDLRIESRVVTIDATAWEPCT